MKLFLFFFFLSVKVAHHRSAHYEVGRCFSFVGHAEEQYKGLADRERPAGTVVVLPSHGKKGRREPRLFAKFSWCCA